MKVRQRQPPSPPTSSFMSKSNKVPRRIVDSDSDTSVEEDGELDDTDGEGPVRPEITRRRLSRPTKRSDRPIVVLDDSDDDEPNFRSSQSLPNQTAISDDSDTPLVTPRSSMRQKGQIVVNEDEDMDEDEEDDEDVQSPAKRRKLARNARQSSPVASCDNSDSQSSRPTRQVTPPNKKSAIPQSSSRKTRSSARKGHRSEKEKKLELLRRRRAGEKELTMSDLNTSDDEGEEDQGGLYDTDSDHQVLDVFEDESDEEPAATAAPAKESKKAKKKQKSQASSRRNEDEDEDDGIADINGNLADFVDDNDDTIGVPDEALYQMPLEFTRASHKPLKAHFKDAVEWLVHRRINPAFERDDEVYQTAWKRLNDEMIGLARSKFISSGWKLDFLRSLRARPLIELLELGAGSLGAELEKCEAVSNISTQLCLYICGLFDDSLGLLRQTIDTPSSPTLLPPASLFA